MHILLELFIGTRAEAWSLADLILPNYWMKQGIDTGNVEPRLHHQVLEPITVEVGHRNRRLVFCLIVDAVATADFPGPQA
jgi:hypothetical protein